MRVGDRTDFDKLNLEIQTDGTLTPEKAFYQACEILMQHFNIIFSGKQEMSDSPKGSGESKAPKAKKAKTVKAKKSNAKKK